MIKLETPKVPNQSQINTNQNKIGVENNKEV